MDENKGVKVEANIGVKGGTKLGAKLGSIPVAKPDAKIGA